MYFGKALYRVPQHIRRRARVDESKKHVRQISMTRLSRHRRRPRQRRWKSRPPNHTPMTTEGWRIRVSRPVVPLGELLSQHPLAPGQDAGGAALPCHGRRAGGMLVGAQAATVAARVACECATDQGFVADHCEPRRRACSAPRPLSQFLRGSTSQTLFFLLGRRFFGRRCFLAFVSGVFDRRF